MKKILIYIISLLIIFLGVFYFLNKNNVVSKDTFETSSSTISQIQSTNIDTKNWINNKNGEYKFVYPENFDTKYISIVDWPPKINIEDKKYSCINTEKSEIAPEGETDIKNINGKEYCITKQSEGAAGSVYTTYTYKTSYKEKTLTAVFTLRFPQCMNYDDPKQSECINEQKSFSIDSIISTILSSVN